jgi:RNA polymerase sporulation-specific sigma factor
LKYKSGILVNIANEILMTIRAGKKTKNEVSIQEPIGIDKEGNEFPLTVYP